MVARAADLDLAVLLRDAKAGLSAWWQAAKDLRDNPLLRLLSQAPRRGRRPGSWYGYFASWAPLGLVLLGLAYVIVHFLTDTRAFATRDPLLLGVLLIALGLFVIWLGTGLYHVAYDALALLSRTRAAAGAELQLDEPVMAARLTDRDFVVAMLASLLPRLWLRLPGAVAVALAGLWLVAGWLSRQEATESLWGYDVRSFDLEAQQLLLKYAPMTFILLCLLAVPVCLTLLLWLIALGRSMTARWQLQLVALSLSLGQLAWLVLSFVHVAVWRSWSGTGHRVADLNLITALIFPLAVLAILVAVLHFTRRQPTLRLLAAASLPLIAAATLLLALMFSVPVRAPWGEFTYYVAFNNWVWIESCFAFVNPLALGSATLLGFSASYPEAYHAFDAQRLPVILAMQLATLMICAHAARLAVNDWRRAEE